MAAKKKKDKGPPSRVAADNRKARHEYFIEDEFEAGIVLTGTEVKSLRGVRPISKKVMLRKRTASFGL